MIYDHASTRRILDTAALVKKEIGGIPELHLLGNPLFVIAIASDVLDIYAISDYMSKKRWNLNNLQLPPAVHLCVTLRHTQPGVAEQFIEDLREAVAHAKANPTVQGQMRPVYGLASQVAFSGQVRDLLKQLIDMLYRPH